VGEPRLIVFVRAPRAGTVKTRLAVGLGPQGALAAYRAIVQRLLKQLESLSRVELYVAPPDGLSEIVDWLQSDWVARPQAEGDLGQRMHAAFVAAFQAGSGPVALIGSDCPYVTSGDIINAWQALAANDAVLGPALDGGYWLVGLRQPIPELFHKMRWSTATVLAETLARCRALGLRTALLRQLADIDTPEDWERNQGFSG
jgi:uncharacterized protein